MSAVAVATAPAVQGLTCRQAQVLDAIVAYHQVTEEPCPSRYLARRLSLHHKTVLEYFTALHRKGWLRGASSPAFPTSEAFASLHSRQSGGIRLG